MNGMVYVAANLSNYKLVLSLEKELADRLVVPSYSWAADYANDADLPPEAIARRCMDGVRSAAVVVFVSQGGRGAHAELGAALVLGKPVVFWDFGSVREIPFYQAAWVRETDREEVIRRVVQAAC